MTGLKILLYLRRFLLEGLLAFTVLTVLTFFYSPDIILFMEHYLGQRLAFYGVFEPMAALIKVAAISAMLALTPWFAFRTAQTLKVILGFTPRFTVLILFMSIALFFSGVLFCFFVTLPFGIEFLLQFGSQDLQPMISVGKFVNFVGLFLLGFGFIFELPLAMILLSKAGVVTPELFIRYRRYAVLVVAIMAAILTPTPDAFNMSLMGIPLYILYELGIVFAKIFKASS